MSPRALPKHLVCPLYLSQPLPKLVKSSVFFFSLGMPQDMPRISLFLSPSTLKVSFVPSFPPVLLEVSSPLSPSQDDEEVTPGYQAPKKVDLQTIQDLDADDEALVKYKAALLGQTSEVKGKVGAVCS